MGNIEDQSQQWTLSLFGATHIRGAAVILAVLLVIGVGVVIYTAPVSADHTSLFPDEDTFEQSASVDVWERSFFTLRADSDGAAYTLPNAEWRVTDGDSEANLNRAPLAVYDTNTEITLSFDQNRANADALSGASVELLRVRVEETATDGTPNTVSDLLDLVTDPSESTEASFTELDSSVSLPDSGEYEFTDTPSASGRYVYVVAVRESGTEGFTVSDNRLNYDGNVTIVGLERVIVRKTPGTLSGPEEVPAGEPLTFDVTTEALEGDQIRHAIAVYHEQTFFRQSFVYELEDDVSSEFDLSSERTLRSDLEDVNGVGHASDSITEYGIDFTDGTIAQSVTIGAIIDFIGEEARTDVPSFEHRSDDTTELDGSATITTSAGASTELTIETFSNWTTGEYRVLYLAVGENSREVATRTHTITIGTPQQSTSDSTRTDDTDNQSTPQTATPDPSDSTTESTPTSTSGGTGPGFTILGVVMALATLVGRLVLTSSHG